MKLTELTVDIKTTVSDETAKRCLRLLEWWFDENPDMTITVEKRPSGLGLKTELHFEKEANGGTFAKWLENQR